MDEAHRAGADARRKQRIGLGLVFFAQTDAADSLEVLFVVVG